MNKVLTSAGFLVLGAAAVYGYDPEMTRARTGRPWTVAAAVRGFYDSNPTLSPDDYDDSSFGFEVSPSVHVNLPLEQTFISAGYIYSFRYYDDREGDDDYDQSHDFNAVLRHAFSPRHDIAITESFIYSKEPTTLDGSGGIVTSPLRTDESAMHNRVALDYNLALTQVWGLGLGYANDWYNYEDSGPASRSAYLDRLEHLFHADLKYQVNPKLVGLVGYQLVLRQYTADEFLYSANSGLKSEARDSTAHFLYVGVDHDFTSQIRGSIRLGGQFTDYDNMDQDDVSPYADSSLTYAYLPASSVKVGIKHQRVATDYVNADIGGTPTLDQEVTAGYVSWTHQITRNLSGNVIGQVQHGTFTDGESDGDTEVLYMLGLNLAYALNQHWTLETGYNFDLLDSEAQSVERDYDRHRAYVGVRASY